jgi:hypothetical protein
VDGLVVRSCTSHPGVLGSIPKREEPGKTCAPCLKYRVPHGSHPPRSLVCGGQTIPHKPRLVVNPIRRAEDAGESHGASARAFPALGRYLAAARQRKRQTKRKREEEWECIRNCDALLSASCPCPPSPSGTVLVCHALSPGHRPAAFPSLAVQVSRLSFRLAVLLSVFFSPSMFVCLDARRITTSPLPSTTSFSPLPSLTVTLLLPLNPS